MFPMTRRKFIFCGWWLIVHATSRNNNFIFKLIAKIILLCILRCYFKLYCAHSFLGKNLRLETRPPILLIFLGPLIIGLVNHSIEHKPTTIRIITRVSNFPPWLSTYCWFNFFESFLTCKISFTFNKKELLVN